MEDVCASLCVCVLQMMPNSRVGGYLHVLWYLHTDGKLVNITLRMLLVNHRPQTLNRESRHLSSPNTEKPFTLQTLNPKQGPTLIRKSLPS